MSAEKSLQILKRACANGHVGIVKDLLQNEEMVELMGNDQTISEEVQAPFALALLQNKTAVC